MVLDWQFADKPTRGRLVSQFADWTIHGLVKSPKCRRKIVIRQLQQMWSLKTGNWQVHALSSPQDDQSANYVGSLANRPDNLIAHTTQGERSFQSQKLKDFRPRDFRGPWWPFYGHEHMPPNARTHTHLFVPMFDVRLGSSRQKRIETKQEQHVEHEQQNSEDDEDHHDLCRSHENSSNGDINTVTGREGGGEWAKFNYAQPDTLLGHFRGGLRLSWYGQKTKRANKNN